LVLLCVGVPLSWLQGQFISHNIAAAGTIAKTVLTATKQNVRRMVLGCRSLLKCSAMIRSDRAFAPRPEVWTPSVDLVMSRIAHVNGKWNMPVYDAELHCAGTLVVTLLLDIATWVDGHGTHDADIGDVRVVLDTLNFRLFSSLFELCMIRDNIFVYEYKAGQLITRFLSFLIEIKKY